jgi:hypothetical protein
MESQHYNLQQELKPQLYKKCPVLGKKYATLEMRSLEKKMNILLNILLGFYQVQMD